MTGQMVADFARAICEALLMLVRTAMTLVIVAGYAIYVVLLYWWRQLLVVLLLLWGILAVGEQVASLLS